MPFRNASLFELVATIIREDPLDAVDPWPRGLLAAIGIRKDKPFAPDARMQGILADAAAVGNATGRAILFSTRDQDAYFYPNSTWKGPCKGDAAEFSPGGVLDLDARTLYFSGNCQISPAAWVKTVGAGSQYAMADHDAAGRYLDGARTCRLHPPPDMPAKDVRSVLVDDPQTRSKLQTDPEFPSLSS